MKIKQAKLQVVVPIELRDSGEMVVVWSGDTWLCNVSKDRAAGMPQAFIDAVRAAVDWNAE